MKLSSTSITILAKVTGEMDAAEEIGGPTGEEYIKLMEAISSSVRVRIMNYKKLHALDPMKSTVAEYKNVINHHSPTCARNVTGAPACTCADVLKKDMELRKAFDDLPEGGAPKH